MEFDAEKKGRFFCFVGMSLGEKEANI